MKRRALQAGAVMALMLATGQVETEGVIGFIYQAFWTFGNLGVAWVLFRAVERRENAEKY